MPKRVAIVHDWLVGGGAEKVVLELHHMFPDAPIYTSYSTDEWRQKLDGKVVTGYLQRFPRLRKYVPFLRAHWFSHLKLSGFDLVISSSGAEAKGIKVTEGTMHINYCHAPTHYYWSRYDEYMKHPGFGILDPLARLGLKLLAGPMRRWDYKAAQRPHHIIANSSYTQSQIKKYYGRDSVVIHPPVDVELFKPAWVSQTDAAQGANENRKGDVRESTSTADRSSQHSDVSVSSSSVAGSASQQAGTVRRSGFIITGRQTPYKRIDLAVQACTKLNLPLTVTGTGPDHNKLTKLAGPSVTFKGWVSQEEVIKSLQTAEAFLFPGIDDFGISAVEALAAGTPVIAYKAGGALDYVVEGTTGLFFQEQTVDSLVNTLKKFNPSSYSSRDISKSAELFGANYFRNKVLSFIQKTINSMTVY